MRSLIITVMLLGGIVTMWNIEWYWLIIALIYSVVVNDIFCHRICSHGMFDIDTKSKTYKIMTWLASMDMSFGPVVWTVKYHNLHHIHSDNGPEDVMNWRYHWYSTAICSPIPPREVMPSDYDEYTKKQWIKHEKLLSDPWTDWCCRNQCAIAIGSFLVLAIVCPIILFKVIFVGRVLLSITIGVASIAGHIEHFPLSYRNFNTRDTTSNNLVLHYLFLGLFAGVLQNNHHGQPKSIRPNPRWFEFDTSYPFVLTLKYLMENKPAPE